MSILVTLVFAATVASVPSLQRFRHAQISVTSEPTAVSTKTSADLSGADVTKTFNLQNHRSINNLLPAAFLFPQPPPPTEPTVTFYDSTCTNPQTIFNPGDVVCAKVEGINTSFYTPHIDWGNVDGDVLAKSTNLTASGQTRTFTLGANASLGSWHAVLSNQFQLAITTGEFTVSDPDNQQVDLSLNSRAQGEVAAGGAIIHRVVIFNNGPDAATNVVLTEPRPANTSIPTEGNTSQLSGPIFTCSADGSGTTTCSISSMPAGSIAILSTTFDVDSGTPNGTTITSSASVTNDHGSSGQAEQNADDNSASTDTIVTNTPCVVTCGDNITVQADSGQAGAVVTYTTPTASGSCPVPEEGPQVTCSQASGSFFPVGTTPVTCVGESGDACTFTVTVENPGALSISLNGANPDTAECGAVVIVDGEPQQGYSDPGANAVNGAGDSVAVTVTGNVDLTQTGSYTLTYTATEGANSVSTTRTVNVVDTTKPSITVQGANPYKIQTGSCLPYADPGASANDGCSGPVAVTSSISGPGGLTHVDNSMPGTYTVTYSATDGSHPATATRTVLVGDFPDDEVDQPSSVGPPTITLNGDNEIVVECHTAFTDPGATASACGQSVAVTTSGDIVDPNTPGTYTITYTATNSAGTAEANRTVTVIDTQAAVITLNGSSPMPVECHSSFTDPGATAHDLCAGDLPVTATGTVDPNTPGTYTITYTAPDDPAGHPTPSKTRTVIVQDTQGPVITINGANPVTVECHTSYTDAGASANDACNGPASVTTSGSVDVNVPGTYTITYSATDGTHSSTATRTVIVADTTPPVITVNGSQPSMWPANHSYHTFQVTDFVTAVSDTCDTGLGVSSVVISQVTSDEPENAGGDGNTTNDIVIAADCKSVQLRAERSGSSNGRVYTITFRVTDASGKVGTATAKVVVPHNPGETPVDSGVNYTVNGSCP